VWDAISIRFPAKESGEEFPELRGPNEKLGQVQKGAIFQVNRGT
jgi:hypothetical protein